jgi:4-hydroxy-2-oxoheptanedioate aldolase
MPERPGNFPQNAFKQALSSFQRPIGLWSGLCSPMVAEIIANAGFEDGHRR